MYFISRHNKFFSRAAAVAPFYRYAASIGAVSVIAAAWFFAVYSPRAAQLHHYEVAVKQCQEQRVLIAHAKRASKDMNSAVANLKGQLAAYQKDKLFSAQLVTFMHQLRAYSLTLKQFFIAKEERIDWYVRKNISVDLQGKLSDAQAFFNQLAHAGIYATCDEIAINRIDDAQCSIKCTIEMCEI